jgi:hypothetical protein
MRLAFRCSVVGLVLAPVGACVWFQGDVGDPHHWWQWVIVLAVAAPTTFGTSVAWFTVGRTGLFNEADRKVWRGWLRMGGPFAAPFILRAAARSEQRAERDASS